MSRDPMFPLATAQVNDGAITIDMMLNEPTRIDRYVGTLVERDLLAKHIFGNVTTSGGALLFDQLTSNEALAANKPGIVAPGAEFPVLHTTTEDPVIAKVQKTGGKFGVTDEAKIRNDSMLLQRKTAQVANTMVQDLDRRGVEALRAASATVSGALTVTSNGWAAATGVKAAEKAAKTAEGELLANLLDAQEAIESKSLGYKPDTLVLSPKDTKNLKLLLGVANYAEVLSSFGLTLYTTTAVEDGEGYVLQAGAVGVMGVESPISTETWRDASIQTTWVQTWATVAFGVTDPFAMVKLTGLGS
ncbi:MAG: hypothetical protein Q3976_07870 [Corynebacterium sp.]|nr:hypothetical protein [Corynebacterium sp.]